MSEPTLKLQHGADDLLQSFPAGEPDFEAQAKAIEARLASGGKSSPSELDDLLKAPDFSPEAGEPAVHSEVRAAPAPKSNFAEMARKSMQKKDDGAELAKEFLAATAQSRRPNAEMVERVRAAGRVVPVASATGTPLPTSSRDGSSPELGAEDAPRTSGVMTRIEAAKPARIDRGTAIGIAGSLLAVAACAALFLQSQNPPSPTSAALAAEKAAPAPFIPARPAAAAATPGVNSNEGVTSPEALAATPEAAAHDPTTKAVTKAAQSGPALAAPSKAGAAPSAAEPAAVVLQDDPEPARAGAAAQQKAEPTPEPKLRPAEGSSDDVPLTPSAGAVSTALSSVRGGAQACLAGQSAPVSAVVTFGADGRVLRVSASGPSSACIQAALSKAHIAPFARESFSATTTIRPP